MRWLLKTSRAPPASNLQHDSGILLASEASSVLVVFVAPVGGPEAVYLMTWEFPCQPDRGRGTIRLPQVVQREYRNRAVVNPS